MSAATPITSRDCSAVLGVKSERSSSRSDAVALLMPGGVVQTLGSGVVAGGELSSPLAPGSWKALRMIGERWEPVGVVTEGDPVVLDGVNIWNVEWTAVGSGSVEVRHPSYPSQVHRVGRYELAGASGVVEFAAGELSANVWGVFVLSGGGR